MKLLWVLFFFSVSAMAAPKNFLKPKEGDPRTVMIQLFEWPWDAIGEECERELGPAGYSAVQISPPQDHIVNQAFWWERYQPVSYEIISRSGTEESLRKMVKRCAKAGVDVYVDVVLNHMTAQLIRENQSFGGATYSHYEYADLWRFEDFHHCRGANADNGIYDFTNLFELQNCELLGMADLNTANSRVQTRQAAYLNHLLDLGVKGFRVDAAKHMSASDLKGIFSKVKRKNYRVLELILSPGEPVEARDYLPVGDINNFSYAYSVGAAFRSGDLSRLPALAAHTGIDTDHASVFLENHDLERRPPSETILSLRNDPQLNKLGMVFLLTWPYGYPAVYSGYSFSNPDVGPPVDEQGFLLSPLDSRGACRAPFTCVHRNLWMKNLVSFRNQTDKNFEATDIWSNGSTVFAFGRSSEGHVVISMDDRAKELELPTQLAPGKYCNLVGESSSDCAQVDEGGILRLRLAPKSAFVAMPKAGIGSKK